jgi:uncharacterized protein (TIGR00255 family)
MSSVFQCIEKELRDFVSQEIKRGSVSVSIKISGDKDIRNSGFRLDKKLAGEYVAILKDLKKNYGLAGEVSIDSLAKFPDIFKKETDSVSAKEAWVLLKKPLGEALKRMQAMRLREGKNLGKIIHGHIRKSLEALESIEKKAPLRIKEYQVRLETKIKELLEKPEIDYSRLMTEVAYMTERWDISEECARFRSHVGQFLDALKKGDQVGKQLNFLLQEMNREANTISSKANDAKIAYYSVFLKEQVEIVREQVQNLE